MKSEDGSSSLQVERREYEDFVNFALTASFHGQIVTNDGVVFSDAPAFVEAATAFEQTRTGAAMLEGTEDCQIAIEPDGRTGDMWLSFQVSRILTSHSPKTGRGRSGHITLAGGFSVSGEFIGKAVHDLKEIFAVG